MQLPLDKLERAFLFPVALSNVRFTAITFAYYLIPSGHLALATWSTWKSHQWLCTFSFLLLYLCIILCVCSIYGEWYFSSLSMPQKPITDLAAEIYFLNILEARSSGSTCQQGWFLLSSLSLACRWAFSPFVFYMVFPLYCQGLLRIRNPLIASF